MHYTDLLEITAHLCAIATAAIAVFAYCTYRWNECQKQTIVENYLRSVKADQDKTKKTILYLTAKLKMTEAEILNAAFRSKKVKVTIKTDAKGYADRMLLEYDA